MDNLDDLIAFLRVADAGGFSAAERGTGIPKSRLSRRVAALESALGVRLVQRSSHAFHLTEIGVQICRHARAIADEAEAVRTAASAAQAEPSGLIRVSASLLTGEMQLACWLAQFMDLYPRVSISLDLSNHYVDLLADRIDLALRHSDGPLAAADVVARPIGTSRMVLIGSPALIDAHDEPTHPADLNRFPAIAQGHAGNIRPWLFRGADGQTVSHVPHARFFCDNLLALRGAALMGVGIAQIPLEACGEALASGTLQELLPSFAPPASTLYALYANRRGLPSGVRMLISFLEERFRTCV